MANWLAHLIVIDTPWSVKDETNPDLERSLRFGTTPTGGVALIGITLIPLLSGLLG